MMNESGRIVAWPAGVGEDLEGFASYEDPGYAAGRPPGGAGSGLVSLGYLGAAVRRRARLLGVLAVIGLLLASLYATAFPHKPQATVSVLLVGDPSQNPADESATDVALAESIPVATAAVHQLGLTQSPSSFAGTYSVVATTTQVVKITASGSTSGAAVTAASAIADQFLNFRARYEQTQLAETESQLNQQVTAAQQKLDAIGTQIKTMQSQPASAARTAALKTLTAQQSAAQAALTTVQNYAAQTRATAQTLAHQMGQGSRVLNQAQPVSHSKLKNELLYAVIGLVAGLAVGVAIAVIGAIVTDRLRRRDDIAAALGAPVRLSVGPLRAGRLSLPGRSAVRQRDAGRVLESLRNAVPGSSKGPASLAVVAVDDLESVARIVVALASAKAAGGSTVVLADLSCGASAARLLGVDGPQDADGLRIDSAGDPDSRITVVVPGADQIAPVGPLPSHASPEGCAQPEESLAAACAGADLVLSVVSLDPAFGAEHLGTWATDAVAVVTAGRSTSVRMHAVGEMIRLAGTRLGSVVVVGSDARDESLGSVTPV
jgi:capsular polysaccharide biosynthesis protein